MSILKENLKHWFRDYHKQDIIVFDTETNGFSPNNSVLSIAAIRLKYNGEHYVEGDRYQRFYYPVEEYNEKAIEVNGLTREVVFEKRKGLTYPEYFENDVDSFEKFCAGTDLFAGHNISFDVKFVPFVQYKKKFCTMYSMKELYYKKYKINKVPKLKEAVLCVDETFDENKLHDSMYDVELTVKVLLKILDMYYMEIK